MARFLHLQSMEGKVHIAPSWDKRPPELAGRPVETGVPSRALGRVLNLWIKHASVELAGGAGVPLTAWDADFLRRLDDDGLRMEFTAAVKQLQSIGDLAGMLPDFARYSDVIAGILPVSTRHRDPIRAVRHGLSIAWYPPDAESSTAGRAAGYDPLGDWCAASARADDAVERQDSWSPHADDAAALAEQQASSRARARQKAEEELLRRLSSLPRLKVTRPAAAPTAPRPPPALLKGTAIAQHLPSKQPASSLRARRGLPELNCKPPALKLLVAGIVKPCA